MTEKEMLLQPELSEEIDKFAADVFKQSGLPSRRNERWKYTDLSRMLKSFEYQLVQSIKLENIDQSKVLNQVSSLQQCVVLVDGQYQAELSKFSQGVTVELVDIACAPKIDYSTHLMAAANQQTGDKLIKVNVNQSPDCPLAIVHYFSDNSLKRWVQPQVQVLVSNNQSVEIQEKVIVDEQCDNSIFNALTFVELQSGANITYTNYQTQNHSIFTIHGLHVYQAKDSSFEYNHISTHSVLYREDIHVHLNQEGANCQIKGVCALIDKSHIDHHILIEHGASYTQSDVNFRSIAANKGVVVCNPKAIVKPDIHSIIAKQSSHNILMDQSAAINTKPELEIYSDDVQCAHGATIGQLDENALFYMCSRGIAENYARQLLVEAFVNVVINEFNSSLKESLSSLISDKIKQYY